MPESVLMAGLLGCLMGFMISIPLGPAGFLILKRALTLQNGLAWRGVFWMQIAEFILASVLFVIYQFLMHSPVQGVTLFLLKSGSALFLILFSLATFLPTHSSVAVPDSTEKRAFWSTLLNPGVWLCLFALRGVLPLEASWLELVLLMLGWQLGVIGWFYLLIHFAPRLGAIRIWVERTAAGLIGFAGFHNLIALLIEGVGK